MSEYPDWLIAHYLERTKDCQTSDQWARKAQEAKLAGLLKLEHRRVGYGAVEFESVIKELRRMLKSNEGAELRFEVMVQVFDGEARKSELLIDQQAASILTSANRS